MDLSVVIVNYNSGDQLGRCLDAIKESRYPDPFEVVVVDNHSTDRSAVLNGESRARLIVRPENQGFARAANHGIASTKSELILILGPDVILSRGTLGEMVRTMRSRPEIGALGPVIREAPGGEHDHLRPFPSNRGLLKETLFLDRLFEDRPSAVGWLHGCCLLLRRAAIDDVGPFDPSFFLYYEDVDLCYRMGRSAWRTTIERGSAVDHISGNRDARYGEEKLRWYHASLIEFYRKHYSRQSLQTLRRILILRSVLRLGLWISLYLIAPSRRDVRAERVRGYAAVLRTLWNGAK
ncbi:MAG: glycosyltransferase family 2 protein [Planctomycetota bacterium]|nr:glycosyltransferase family 2 protein [Planctomycetota bacterium]